MILSNAVLEATKNSRVCPQPMKWQKLYDLLPNKKRNGSSWEPPPPLILAAWWDAPALMKMLRLKEHLDWAAKHGCLDTVCEFMAQLKEEDWYHVGE